MSQTLLTPYGTAVPRNAAMTSPPKEAKAPAELLGKRPILAIIGRLRSGGHVKYTALAFDS